MQLPVDSLEKGHFVGVDLTNLETGYLAPRASRVVAVLQILGCQDEGGEKHAAPALESATPGGVDGLLHGEVVVGHVSLDEDEVVEGDLQGGEAGARTPERFLDEGAQRQDAVRAPLARSRNGPDHLDHGGGGVLMLCLSTYPERTRQTISYRRDSRQTGTSFRSAEAAQEVPFGTRRSCGGGVGGAPRRGGRVSPWMR